MSGFSRLFISAISNSYSKSAIARSPRISTVRPDLPGEVDEQAVEVGDAHVREVGEGDLEHLEALLDAEGALLRDVGRDRDDQLREDRVGAVHHVEVPVRHRVEARRKERELAVGCHAHSDASSCRPAAGPGSRT